MSRRPIKLRPAFRYYWKSIVVSGVLVYIIVQRAIELDDLWGISILFCISALMPFYFALLRRSNLKYTIDDAKISSYYTIQESYISIKDLCKVEVRRGLIQRILGIGNLSFYSSSTDDEAEVIFLGIPAPRRLKSRFDKNINRLKKESKEAEKRNSKVYQLIERVTKLGSDKQGELTRKDDLLWYSRRYSSFSLHSCFVNSEIENTSVFQNTLSELTAKQKIEKDDLSNGIPFMYKTWGAGETFLVRNFDHIEKGQSIFDLKIHLLGGYTPLRSIADYPQVTGKAARSGYFEKVNTVRETHAHFLSYIIYDDQTSYLSHRFTNRHDKVTDRFSQDITIKWSAIGSPSEELIEAFKLCGKIYNGSTLIYINKHLGFKPVNVNGADFITFEFDYKNLKLKAEDTISLLLENQELIEYQLPDKFFIVKQDQKKAVNVFLTRDELEQLSQFSIDTVRIYQKSIDYKTDIPIQEYLDTWVINKTNKQFLIKNLFEDHFSEIENLVDDYKPLESKAIPVNGNDVESCHVYLMVDTVNNFHKIGISNNPKYREHTLQSEKPTVEFICSKEFPIRSIAGNIEKALHNTFESKRWIFR